MHDIKFIRENSKLFDKGMKDRGIHSCSEEILFIDNIVRENKSKIQDLQHERKEIAKQISSIHHEDEKFKIIQERGYDIKHKLHILEEQKNEAQEKLNNFLITLPNIPEEGVPYGEKEEDNKIFKLEGIYRLMQSYTCS